MKIVFCMPGRSYSGEFLQSWSTLMVELQSAGIQFAISQKYDPVVYYARNRCLGGDLLRGEKQLPFQGQTDYDYIMWIDSDIIFKPEHFFKLLQHDKDIVSGLYMMTDLKHYATVENWDEEYFKKHGSFPFAQRTEWIGRKGLVSVDYTGFGWMLV